MGNRHVCEGENAPLFPSLSKSQNPVGVSAPARFPVNDARNSE